MKLIPERLAACRKLLEVALAREPLNFAELDLEAGRHGISDTYVRRIMDALTAEGVVRRRTIVRLNKIPARSGGFATMRRESLAYELVPPKPKRRSRS